jgi:hypothetical protein
VSTAIRLNQLCDLVQRSLRDGCAVRVHVTL